MPKRARASDTDSDTDANDSEFLEASDVSYFEAPKHHGKKSRHRRGVAPRRASRPTSVAGPSTISHATHPASWHVVVCVEPIRESLLQWYKQIRDVRGMPWRKTFEESLDTDGRAQRAYEVWVSEVMLQQTQVSTVIPYYTKWMAKFPTVRDLAASDIDTVNSLWKGLGYYSRAARLLSGAQKVVKELDGRLPNNSKDMQAKIPGIGRYSAGAICSIAYNQCVPVLDGNVIRLLARFLALYAPPKGKQAQDILWAGAEAFVEGSSHPGDINQALIELGSTVCKVRDPACRDCPLRSWCRAYEQTQDNCKTQEEGDIEEICSLCDPFPEDDLETRLVTIYPMKVERKKAREELDSVNVIEWCSANNHKRFFLLVRRPEGGLLAGLHEFPTMPNILGTSATVASAAKIPGALLKDLLVDPPSISHSKGTSQGHSQQGGGDGDISKAVMRIVHVKCVGDVIHVFSHIRKTYRVQWVLLQGGRDEPPGLRQKSKLSMDPKAKTMRNGKFTKRPQALEDTSAGKSDTTDVARWVSLDQVEHANISTGMMKVWKLAQTLW